MNTRERERREKRGPSFYCLEKKVQKQKGFVDAKISARPSPPHASLISSSLSHYLLHSCSSPYLQTHYMRFVLKTVQFIGAGLLILFLWRLYILLFEGVSRCGVRAAGQKWFVTGARDPLVITYSLITATPEAARLVFGCCGYYTCKSTAARSPPPAAPPNAYLYMYCMCLSGGVGFYKSADVLWRSH